MKNTFGALGLVGIVGSATATIATVAARPALEVARANVASVAFSTSGRASNAGGGPRHLQGTCSSDAVTISVADSTTSSSASSESSRYEAFAGCYQDTGLISSQLPYYTPSGLDLPYTYIGAFDINATESSSTSTFARWVLGDHETEALACASNEPAESVHPGEATWFCSDDASADEVTPVSAECGGTCENSDPGETTCSSETVFVTSSAFPSFEGCYEPTGEEAFGQPIYSKGGELVEGEPLIFTTNVTFITGTEGLIWDLGLLVNNTVPTRSCASGPSNNIVHPADALWSCDIDGDSVLGYFPSETADTPGLFEVNCQGTATTCTDASSSSATEGSTANSRGFTSSGSDSSTSTSDDEETTAEETTASDDATDSESTDSDSESEDDDTPNGGSATATNGGVRLAADPKSSVSGVVAGLAMAMVVGALGAL